MKHPLILFPYSPHYVRIEKSINHLHEIWKKLNVRLMTKCCTGPTDYEDTVKALWNDPGDLIIWEHDMYPSLKMVQRLISCEQEICCQQCHIRPTPEEEYPYAHRVREFHAFNDTAGYTTERWATAFDTFCDLWGLGLTKLSKTARMCMRPTHWQPGQWFNLDGRISHAYYLKGLRAHIHYPPCQHDHTDAKIRGLGEKLTLPPKHWGNFEKIVDKRTGKVVK